MNAIRLGTLLIILGLLGIPTDSLAQATDPTATGMWAGVERVPPGEKLIVKLKDGKKVKGTLRSVSDTGLTLAHGKRTTDLDREKVQQIFRLMPKSAGKAILIGVGVGLAAAAAIAGVGCKDYGGGAFDCWALGMGFVVGPVAGIGALAGWGIGSGKKRVLIYDAQVLKALATPRSAKENSP